MTLTLHHREYGTGSPLVILHGLLGNSANWQRPARALAEQHRVFALDLRNHGRSPHAAEMDLSTLAADVRAFMDAHELVDATILGHSLGGKVAMTLALETPARVSRLAVVDIAPNSYTAAGLDDITDALLSLDLTTIRDLKGADERLAQRLPDAAMRAFLLTNLKAEPSGYRWRVNLPGIASAVPAIRGWTNTADSYDGPTLFIAGARSDYIRETHHAAIAQQFPQAELLRVNGAGHWVHAEKPIAFMAAVRPFLAGDAVAVDSAFERLDLQEVAS